MVCRNCEKRSRFHDWTARTQGCEGCKPAAVDPMAAWLEQNQGATPHQVRDARAELARRVTLERSRGGLFAEQPCA